MCRHVSSFVFVFVALAACSPSYFSGGQVARAVSQETYTDSSSFHRLVDRIVSEELQKKLEVREWEETVNVTETLSQPDSTGKQHVTERTTARISRRKDTSAGVTQTKDEVLQERTDSTHKTDMSSSMLKEEERYMQKENNGFMPWYVYVAALVGAVIVGFILGMKIRR